MSHFTLRRIESLKKPMAEEGDYSVNDERVDYSDCPAAFVVGGYEIERRRGDALRLIERAG